MKQHSASKMSSQSQSQSQVYQNAQRLPATDDDLNIQIKDYISKLITRNNRCDEDQGVLKVLGFLDKDDPIKDIRAPKNKILKPQLVATLGFLNYLSFETASESYKGILVDKLAYDIVEKFNLLKPDICRNCRQIYNPDDMEIGDSCFVCSKTLCPSCCPSVPDNDLVNKVYFSICTGCSSKKTPQTQLAPRQNPQETPVVETPKAPQQEKSEKICSFHLRRSCNHRKNPENCRFQHPKLCFDWMKLGKCRNTDKCREFHHPKLCHSVRKGEQCNREKCRAVHLWTREKTLPQQPLQPQTTPQVTPQQQPQQQQLAPPQQQQTTFLSPPPQIPPPDPVLELRRMVESLTLKVDKILSSPPQSYPIHYVRT